MTAPSHDPVAVAAAGDLLAQGDLRPLGLLPRASNHTFLAELCAGERSTLAVYKPRAGEAPLWDFPRGTLCLREVAAYELSRELGWPAVPPTVLRDGPHGPGSVQLFVGPTSGDHYLTLREEVPDVFREVAAFDVVANNADRKSGHCLRDAAGTVWVIDHGVCFSVEPKLRTVIWDFAGEPVPSPLLDDLDRLSDALRGGLGERMRGLLSPEEVEAAARRADRLVAAGRFPHPGAGRAYPWPPV